MLTRWEPFGGLRRRSDFFGDLTDMQQEMNRLFDEFFGDRRAGLTEGQWMPAVDVSETDSELVVRAELPGMTHDDIELNLQDNVLTIKGEKKQEKKDEQENFHRLERSYGSFSRSFSLPAGVKPGDIAANFKDGILEVSMPKSEEAKPKKNRHYSRVITPGVEGDVSPLDLDVEGGSYYVGKINEMESSAKRSESGRASGNRP